MPTALRSPDENTRPLPPFSSNRMTAARSGDFSTHMLQLDPIATYIALSAPNAIERLQCPPPPLYEFDPLRGRSDAFAVRAESHANDAVGVGDVEVPAVKGEPVRSVQPRHGDGLRLSRAVPSASTSRTTSPLSGRLT